jgi:5'-nucleotidase
MLILVDQDGALADFERGFYDAWQANGHAHKALPLADRRNFYVRDDYPKYLNKKIEVIYTATSFYRNLPPIAGAIESLKELLALGHDVCICTSPLNAYHHCVLEKY